ncbi:hypothetical protein EVAR_10956_1 [Eumeta japonica]|uniref:Uncharacterized protein n=1 Tax=Eumeta variegata TaxID=151549 RepID=A0A4C1U6Q6_EUMVA|nr:hypothetical protein EVAR_10956_1 [Eumeta japonica]
MWAWRGKGMASLNTPMSRHIKSRREAIARPNCCDLTEGGVLRLPLRKNDVRVTEKKEGGGEENMVRESDRAEAKDRGSTIRLGIRTESPAFKSRAKSRARIGTGRDNQKGSWSKPSVGLGLESRTGSKS